MDGVLLQAISAGIKSPFTCENKFLSLMLEKKSLKISERKKKKKQELSLCEEEGFIIVFMIFKPIIWNFLEKETLVMV